jgi:hypothetical protein
MGGMQNRHPATKFLPLSVFLLSSFAAGGGSAFVFAVVFFCLSFRTLSVVEGAGICCSSPDPKT